MPLNAFLDPLRDQTREIRTLVAAWQTMPRAALLRQPAPGSWSLVQCLDHLNGYGAFYLPHLGRALQNESRPAREFRSGWLGDYFARSMEPGADGRPKSKMKAFAKHVPPPDLDAAAVVRCFLDQQDELLGLMERAERIDLNGRVVPLSIAGWLRLRTGDVFRFMVAHNRRHIAQARRALEGAGHPVGA